MTDDTHTPPPKAPAPGGKTPVNQAQNWGNYWQGRTAEETGAALAGVGVETDAQIGAFWTAELSRCTPGAAFLDLACGAGSVVRRALEAGLTDVSGLDISKEAVAALRAAYPSAVGIVAPADATGLDAGSFDVVTSQFGFEYADPIKAAKESARLLRVNGRFIALTHAKDSGIEREVAANGGAAQAIVDSGFIPTAKAVFDADLNGGSDEAFAAAAKAFSGPQSEVLKLGKAGGSLASNLYQGTQTLYERRKAYTLADITGWLDAMGAEIMAYIGRMDSMQSAALSEAQARGVLKTLAAGGLTPKPLLPFISERSGESLGWIIMATDKR